MEMDSHARESVCAAVSSVKAWSTVVFGQCFSRIRRMQFDEEHQRSLLSCHATDQDDEHVQMLDDAAMLELRRRVQYVEMRHSSPLLLRPEALPLQKDATDAATRKLQMLRERRKVQQQRRAQSQMQTPGQSQSQSQSQSQPTDSNQPNSALNCPELDIEDQEQDAEFTMLLSSAEKALSDILNRSSSTSTSTSSSGSPVASLLQHRASLRPEDVTNLSVDELLALDVNTSNSNNSISEISETEEEPAPLTEEAQRLRQWLASIDPSRAEEFVAYATSFEKQGFHCQHELAELDQEDVEQAMSEIGVAKFAHRARLRKAILRLRSSRDEPKPPAPNNNQN